MKLSWNWKGTKVYIYNICSFIIWFNRNVMNSTHIPWVSAHIQFGREPTRMCKLRNLILSQFLFSFCLETKDDVTLYRSTKSPPELGEGASATWRSNPTLIGSSRIRAHVPDWLDRWGGQVLGLVPFPCRPCRTSSKISWWISIPGEDK